MFGSKARAERRQQAEADRLFAMADELAKQAGKRPNYQREITADRAERVMRQELATPYGMGYTEDRNMSWDEYIRGEFGGELEGAQASSGPGLSGAARDAEIERLGELYPEDGDVRMERADRQLADDLVQPAEAEEAAGLGIPVEDRQRDDPPWLREAGERYQLSGETPSGRTVQGDPVYREPAGPAEQQEPAGRPAPGYYRSSPGSAQHQAAYAEMFAAADGIGFADPDADLSYEIDNAGELAAERYYEELAERHYREMAGGHEAEDAGPGEDAARWSPDAADDTQPAPDHLYGSPECAEDDPETAHFGRSQPEPEDAGHWPAQVQPEPLPRLLEPAEANPVRAPRAVTLPDGTPHADPFLAERGWQAQGGLYVRHDAGIEREAG